ncbi:MAG: hypothetical protein ABIT76_08925 [Chthoniobacterales bacterium]
MRVRPLCLFSGVFLLLAASLAAADSTALYLLDGTVVRGEIVDRDAQSVQMKTPKGVVKVKTAGLRPISRQQLKLAPEEEKTSTPEMEALLAQMEKVIAENASLKQQVESLKRQLAKPVSAVQVASPAEGPAAKH